MVKIKHICLTENKEIMEKTMEKEIEFNASNGVHVKMVIPVEVTEAEKQRKIEALYDALNTSEPPTIESIQFAPEFLSQKA